VYLPFLDAAHGLNAVSNQYGNIKWSDNGDELQISPQLCTEFSINHWRLQRKMWFFRSAVYRIIKIMRTD